MAHFKKSEHPIGPQKKNELHDSRFNYIWFNHSQLNDTQRFNDIVALIV